MTDEKPKTIPLGFILTRCVKKKTHDLLWKECYELIRKHYDDPIIIIDDNSDKSLITEIELKNTSVIKSEFIGAGELLPYYYLYKLHPFEKAVVLHDSMFIKNKIDFSTIKDIKFLWHFSEHKHDNGPEERLFLSALKNSKELIEFYKKKELWYGCFGVSSVITYDFVKLLNDKYNFFELTKHIKTRPNRMCLERVFGLLAFYEKTVTFETCSIFGSIYQHFSAFNVNYDSYKKNNNDIKQDIVKIWSGR